MRTLLMLIALVVLSSAAAEIPEATKYLTESKLVLAPITVDAWTCTNWSPKTLVRRYCDQSIMCRTGCRTIVEDTKRTRKCCDETQVNCYTDTAAYSQFVGCCGSLCVKLDGIAPEEVK